MLFRTGKKGEGGGGGVRNVKRLNLDWIDSLILRRKRKNGRRVVEETVFKAAQFHSVAGLMVFFGQKTSKTVHFGRVN